jgi:hypothetical protein
MFNLLKKDILINLKTDVRTIIKLIIGIIIFSFILPGAAFIYIPLFISYIIIFKTFHMDENNKCNLFLSSMPIDKEDIVYSKYIFSILIILISIMLTYIYFNSPLVLYKIPININMILMSIGFSLLLISICFPIIFKNGYMKSSGICTLVLGIIYSIAFAMSVTPRALESYKLITRANITIESLILISTSIVLYIISMYLSLKIYSKKEVIN